MVQMKTIRVENHFRMKKEERKTEKDNNKVKEKRDQPYQL
jgi:hypothetical protein